MGKLYLGTQAITPILNRGGGGGNEPGGNIKITAYDTAAGVISGGGFGSTPGYVYVLDRDTNTYVAQTVSSWTPSSITLDTPVDLTTLEGTTSMAVVADDGTWSNKWLLTGDVAVSGWGKLYLQNPDTRAVYTVAVTSQTDFEKLCGGTGSNYSRQFVVGGNTLYTDEILGFQFGSDFNLTTIGDGFLAGTGNMVQPIVIPSAVTSIGGYFLAYAVKFNHPLAIPSGVTSIGDSFLDICSAFNQPLVIPSGASIQGNRFMAFCYNFNQPLTLPSNATSIGNNFMTGCYTFNQPLTIPSNVSSIGNYFLQSCRSFNHPITVPSSVSIIGTYFLYGCDAFSSLTVNTNTHPTDINSLATNAPADKIYAKGVTVKGTGRSTWISALPNRTSNPFRKLIDGGE